ncbi:protein of unknown function [Candidatus Filomicrobium marinum]|uniref:Uncharacterized protein n=1 Tax=Candidatus Filomicrobium marinum TaxID=1608628 RepID=A0A0D6JI61_9HYPH|nr:protein of unknown function [Candidatus Filomicrobium marinum]CPR20899.1 protein of unknown function [Candidatus Filomicrobium marinum]
MRQQRLTAACRTDQQDVRLGELDVIVLGRVIETLVVVVDRNREHTLSVILANDVRVQNLTDFLWCWNAVTRLYEGVLVFLADDIHAEFNAFIADEHGWPGNQFSNLVLALSAEGAIKGVLLVRHSLISPVVEERDLRALASFGLLSAAQRSGGRGL